MGGSYRVLARGVILWNLWVLAAWVCGIRTWDGFRAGIWELLNRDTILGVSILNIVRTIVVGGPYWGPLFKETTMLDGGHCCVFQQP